MSATPKAVRNKMRNKFTEESFRSLDLMPLKLRLAVAVRCGYIHPEWPQRCYVPVFLIRFLLLPRFQSLSLPLYDANHETALFVYDVFQQMHSMFALNSSVVLCFRLALRTLYRSAGRLPFAVSAIPVAWFCFCVLLFIYGTAVLLDCMENANFIFVEIYITPSKAADLAPAQTQIQC